MATDAPLASGGEEHTVDRSDRLVILASSVGTVIEWYDFYLYGSLAAIIAKQFFSGVNPTTGMIFALLAFAAVIPYIAVVLANARRADPEADGPQAVTPRREGLTAPTGEPTGPRVDRPGEVIVGDVVDD